MNPQNVVHLLSLPAYLMYNLTTGEEKVALWLCKIVLHKKEAPGEMSEEIKICQSRIFDTTMHLFGRHGGEGWGKDSPADSRLPIC